MRTGVRKIESGYYILAGCIILRRAKGWSVHSEATGELYAETDTKKKAIWRVMDLKGLDESLSYRY